MYKLSVILTTTLLSLAMSGLAYGVAPSDEKITNDGEQSIWDSYTSVSDEMLLNPNDNDWLMYRRTYNAWGYSPLEQINKNNANKLKMVWSWAMTDGPTEITPLVHDGVLFLHNAGDTIQALNAKNGNLLWEYSRSLPENLVSGSGDIIPMRDIALYEDKVIIATTDVHVIALNAKTGEIEWDQQIADWHKGWRFTGGPMVVDGIVIQPTSGCGNAEPGGCFISGLDADTGQKIWRTDTIARPGTPDGDTWNGLPLKKRHGASAWNAPSYDPDLGLIYQGVGQPYPWIAEINGLLPKRTGKNNDALYTDSTLAINPKNGKIVWYFQHAPTDTWDLDWAYERVLVKLPIDGEMRKSVVTAGKTGIVEALSRDNGEFFWAVETVPQNVVSDIDSTTGEVKYNEDSIPHIGKTTLNCPADPGSRGWPATAYNPDTHALYIPTNRFCAKTTPVPIPDNEVYTGGGHAIFKRIPVPGSDGNIGGIKALNLYNQKTIWETRQHSAISSAMLTTAGGLVFGGSIDRSFKAYDDETGEVLWSTRLSNVVNATPITYKVDGKQYIAIAVSSDGSALRSWSSLTPKIQNPEHGAALFVFALSNDQ